MVDDRKVLLRLLVWHEIISHSGDKEIAVTKGEITTEVLLPTFHHTTNQKRIWLQRGDELTVDY